MDEYKKCNKRGVHWMSEKWLPTWTREEGKNACYLVLECQCCGYQEDQDLILHF